MPSPLPPSRQAGITMHWVDSVAKAGSFCSKRTGLCCTYAHVVFSATPADGDVIRRLAGGARFSIDGGAMHLGSAVTFERHLVSGICYAPNHLAHCETYGPSQMFNWGYEVTVEPVARQLCPTYVRMSSMPPLVACGMCNNKF